jgi:lysophospholipase L1-like esterase
MPRVTTSPLQRIAAATLALAASAALVLAGTTAAQAAPPSGTEGLQYVALGDSYAAGFGLSPITNLPAVGCQQAQSDYPHQVAAALGLTLTDVTCTGAVTANITSQTQTPPSDLGGGSAVPQILALSADTDVVTVTIGGNDTGFADIASACVAGSAGGPVIGTGSSTTYNTCEAAFAAAAPTEPQYDFPTYVTSTVADNLRSTFAQIRAAAPNATVIVVGYPSLLPDPAHTPLAGCFTPIQNGTDPNQNSLPFTTTDVPFIHSIEVVLNEVIADEAQAAGFAFIDNQAVTLDHSACPQTASPYINGITLSSPIGSAPPIVNGALHPNATGVAFLSGQVTNAIAAAFPAAPAPAPAAPAPSPSSSAPALAATGHSDADIVPPLLIAGAAFAAAACVLLLARRSRMRRD